MENNGSQLMEDISKTLSDLTSEFKTIQNLSEGLKAFSKTQKIFEVTRPGITICD